jgi:hypothetical protein
MATVAECRFYARECARWAEASSVEHVRKTLLEVARTWSERAYEERAAAYLRTTEPEKQPPVGCSRSCRNLHVRQKHPAREMPLNRKISVQSAPLVSAGSVGSTRGKDRVPEHARPHPSDVHIGWCFAIFLLAATATVIGWGWGNRNGGGWGRDNLARTLPPGAGSLHGPATRAWTPPSNGRFR